MKKATARQLRDMLAIWQFIPCAKASRDPWGMPIEDAGSPFDDGLNDLRLTRDCLDCIRIYREGMLGYPVIGETLLAVLSGVPSLKLDYVHADPSGALASTTVTTTRQAVALASVVLPYGLAIPLSSAIIHSLAAGRAVDEAWLSAYVEPRRGTRTPSREPSSFEACVQQFFAAAGAEPSTTPAELASPANLSTTTE